LTIPKPKNITYTITYPCNSQSIPTHQIPKEQNHKQTANTNLQQIEELKELNKSLFTTNTTTVYPTASTQNQGKSFPNTKTPP